MLEWDDVTRHWWRYDKDRIGMVHRATGEAILHRGQLPRGGWHRFDYQHDDGFYPLIVEMKRVEYPNPSPNALNRPPWNTGPMPTLRHWVWHVDHEQSLEEWRRSTGGSEDLPPYWLWRRADIAIIEAGLLWPEKTPVQPADEFALNSGWANDDWRAGYYRRIGWREPLLVLLSSFRIASGLAISLPISEHSLVPKNEPSARWVQSIEPAVDGFGRPLSVLRPQMRRSDHKMILAKAVDQRGYYGDPRTLPLAAIWDGSYLIAPLLCRDADGSSRDEANPSAVWEAPLNAPVSIGQVSAEHRQNADFGVGKRLVSRDVFFQRPNAGWTHDLSIIDHPLSSYSFWASQFDARMNALPFCRGLERTDNAAAPVQGEVGTVIVDGGYIGGLQGMRAQVRLAPVVATDQPNSDWRRFF